MITINDELLNIKRLFNNKNKVKQINDIKTEVNHVGDDKIYFRPCLQCGKNFIIISQKKFCSTKCRDKHAVDNKDYYKKRKSKYNKTCRIVERDRKKYKVYKKIHPDK